MRRFTVIVLAGLCSLAAHAAPPVPAAAVPSVTAPVTVPGALTERMPLEPWPATLAAPALPAVPKGTVDALLGQLQTVGSETGHVASQLLNTAFGLIGVPYRMGGNSAETGFDCSGFVRYVYANTLGLVLPRRAADQAQATTPIAKSELKPGDLVFFNTMRRAFSHVGVYLGDGKFIHSPSKGDSVKISDMNDRYWANRFNGARRVDALEPAAPAVR